MALEDLLKDYRDQIIGRFLKTVQRDGLVPPGAAPSVLIDHIPAFLDDIARQLSKPAVSSAPTSAALTESAREHGEQRWQSGFDLKSVITEYAVLRRSILETAREAGVPLSAEEADALSSYLELGVVSATQQYVQAREEQLGARQSDLEFLIHAGDVLGSTLDYESNLGELQRLLVPRFADLCLISVEGNGPDDIRLAHADPSKAEAARETLRTNEASAAGSVDAVLRTSRPVLVHTVEPELFVTVAVTLKQQSLMRALGARSWMAVPLPFKTGRAGTLTLAWTESVRSYSQTDLLLAADIARRASTALDKARLYHLSQEDRSLAEAATRTKDEFVAMVSHELRNPLNAIIGWARLLRSRALPEGTREHALEVIERNANAEIRLVGDLLDISRMSTGKIQLNPAQIDLGGLLRLVLEDARFSLEAKRIGLNVHVGDDVVIRGDAERLKQVIWNLLLNAIKFTPKGGEVSVALRRVESEVELEVVDNGVGIASDFLPAIFDRFRQADSKTNRSYGGLGIGLSIAKYLVELHGGSIAAFSEGLGKGARFVVRLPVSPLITTTVGVSKVPTKTAPRLDLSRSKSLSGLTVLVVDDEPDAREMIRVLLEFFDARVHEAGSAAEALQTVTNEPIDLIVSDVGMPGEDGYALVRSLRALPVRTKAELPAVALTAFSTREDRAHALREGFDLHLSKPVEPADLLDALAKLSTRRPPGRHGGEDA